METGHNTEEKEKIPPTETATFRIDHDILNVLREELKEQKESLNALLNRILKLYVRWHKPSLKAGNIHFSKNILTRIFDILSDEQINKVAEDYVKYDFKGQIQMLKQEYSLQSFIEAGCSWCEVSGFPYRHDVTSDSDLYTIQFNMGTKWAMFYGKHMQNILSDLEVKNSEVKVKNNTVMFKI